MTYGDWLRSERRKRGLSQAQLGDLAGKHRTHINRIENSGIDRPDESTRFQIHRALGTTEDDLVAAGVLVRMDFAGGPFYAYSDNIPVGTMDIDSARRIAERHDPDAYQALEDAGNEAVLARALRAYGLNDRQVSAILAVIGAFTVKT